MKHDYDKNTTSTCINYVGLFVFKTVHEHSECECIFMHSRHMQPLESLWDYLTYAYMSIQFTCNSRFYKIFVTRKLMKFFYIWAQCEMIENNIIMKISNMKYLQTKLW